MYQKVTFETIKKLEKIVGETNVLTDRVDKEGYSHDETTGLKHFPEVVVRPKNTNEVVKIISLANKEKIPLTPRGG